MRLINAKASDFEAADQATPSSLKTLEEATLLALSDWQGSVAKLRLEGKAETSKLVSAVREDAEVFEFLREIFEVLALPRQATGARGRLSELARRVPEAMPKMLKAEVQMGALAGSSLPWGASSLLRSRLRSHLNDLLKTVSLESKSVTLADSQLANATANFEVWGSRVFGPSGALNEAKRLKKLIETHGIKNLTVDVAQFVPFFDSWSHEEVVASPPDGLVALLEACALNDTSLTLTARSFENALLLPDLLRAVLERFEFKGLKVSLHLFIDLPETQQMIADLLSFSKTIKADGAKLGVTLTDRSFAHIQQVAALNEGLPSPNLETPAAKDQNFALALSKLLSQANAGVHVTVESGDPVLVAFARTLANTLGKRHLMALQLRRGLSPALAAALAAQGPFFLATPITRPGDFQNALPELLETLSLIVEPEGAFESSALLFDSDEISGAPVREELRPRVRHLIESLNSEPAASHRVQRRDLEWQPEAKESVTFYKPPTEAHRFDTGGLTAAVLQLQKQETGELKLVRSGPARSIPAVSPSGFANEPDTDVTNAQNREWLRSLVKDSVYGQKTRQSVTLTQSPDAEAADIWLNLPATERIKTLKRVALALVAARDRLVEALTLDRGLPPREIDFEINRAVDAVRYVALRAEGLRVQRGAVFVPGREVLIVADDTVTFSAMTEAVVSALAVGSSVHILTGPLTTRALGVLFDELYQGGVAAGALNHTMAEGGDIEHELKTILDAENMATNPTPHAIFLGSETLAEAARRWRPSLIREVRPAGGAGVAIITPNGQKDVLIGALVRSAFKQSGAHPQKIIALIIAGGIAKKDRFRDDLKDAVASLRTSRAGHNKNVDALAIDVGPLPRRPNKQEMRALTELDHGESWLLAPRQLDEDGMLWSPGVRLNVKPGSWFWRAAQTVPVLGVLETGSLTGALEAQTEIGAEAMAALYSDDQNEIREWISHTNSATLALNKADLAARIERTPVGSWAAGTPTPLVGGPNRLLTLGSWQLREGTQSETLHLRGLDENVRALIEAAQRNLQYEEFDILRRAALADVLAFKTQFRGVKELTALQHEHNLLRYKNALVQVRAMSDAKLADLMRVIVAGVISGSDFSVSTANELPPKIETILMQLAVPVFNEDDDEWLKRAALEGEMLGGFENQAVTRIRLLGGDPNRAREWLSSHPKISVISDPVTIAGSIELLTFLREQALTINLVHSGFLLGEDRLTHLLA